MEDAFEGSPRDIIGDAIAAGLPDCPAGGKCYGDCEPGCREEPPTDIGSEDGEPIDAPAPEGEELEQETIDLVEILMVFRMAFEDLNNRVTALENRFPKMVIPKGR
jgi:hypothetical protein